MGKRVGKSEKKTKSGLFGKENHYKERTRGRY